MSTFQELYQKVKSTMGEPVRERYETPLPKEIYDRLSLEDKIRIHLVSSGYFTETSFVPFDTLPFYQASEVLSEDDLLHEIHFVTTSVLYSVNPRRGVPDDHYLFAFPYVQKYGVEDTYYFGLNPKYRLSRYQSRFLSIRESLFFSDPTLIGSEQFLLASDKRLFLYTADRKHFWLDEAEDPLPDGFSLDDVTDDLLASRLGRDWTLSHEQLSDDDIERYLNG